MSVKQCFSVCLFFICALLGTVTASSPCDIMNNSLICDGRGLTDITNITSAEEKFIFLNFSNNNVKALYNDTFKDYPDMETLHLQGNDIHDIELGAFSTVKHLINIDLSENYLSYIHPDIFLFNTKLETVILLGNPLFEADFSVPFLNAPSVVNLDLSYCGIPSISEKSFSLLRNLYRLDLTSNNLQSLSLKTLNYLPKIKIVNLGYNRWSCDCKLSMLLKWVKDIRPIDEHDHPLVYCYAENGDEKTKVRLTEIPGELKYCNTSSNNKNNNISLTETISTKEDTNKLQTLPTSFTKRFTIEPAMLSSKKLNTTTLIEKNPSKITFLPRNDDISFIVSYIVVALLLVVGVLMAFSIIKCFSYRHFPYKVTNGYIPEYYLGGQKLITPAVTESIYEYVK